MKHYALIVAVSVVLGCGGETEESAAPERVAAEPAPEAEAEQIVEMRYPPDFPWGGEMDGFTLNHLYGPGEFREVCERNGGRFEVADRGSIRGALVCAHIPRRGPSRMVRLDDQERSGRGSCSWHFDEYYDDTEATDAVISPYFQDMMSLNTHLTEHDVYGSRTGIAGAHIQFDGSQGCWGSFGRGDFECVRRGYAGATLMTSIGTHIARMGADRDATTIRDSIGFVHVSIRHSTQNSQVILGRSVHVSACTRAS